MTKPVLFHLEIIALDKLPEPEQFLTEKEFAAYRGFKSEKRKREWLGGRLAAKNAVLKSLDKNPGITCKDVAIFSDSDRIPHLDFEFCHFNLSAPPPVSISHSGGYAAAAVGLGDCLRLGVDLEKIEKRTEEWAEQSFHADEKVRNDEISRTAAWTRKEAALKALGLGLSCDMWDLRIRNSGFEFKDRALKRWEELGKPQFEVSTWEKPKGYILSVASAAKFPGGNVGSVPRTLR